MTGTDTLMCCSFCGKSQDDVNRMVAGPEVMNPSVFICDGCIRLCYAIIDESAGDER